MRILLSDFLNPELDIAVIVQTIGGRMIDPGTKKLLTNIKIITLVDFKEILTNQFVRKNLDVEILFSVLVNLLTTDMSQQLLASYSVLIAINTTI